MKLKKILLGLAYMSVMASCADLDYHEYTVYDKDYVFTDFGRTGAVVTNIYSYLDYDLPSEVSYCSACDEAQFAWSWSSIHDWINGAWSLTNSHSLWNYYSGIRDANFFLEESQNADFSELKEDKNYVAEMNRFNRYKYEVRFLRAYFYFNLVRAYGDIPLVTKVLTEEEANQVKRTPAAEVFDFIIKECDEIADELPVDYSKLENDAANGESPETVVDAYEMKVTGKAWDEPESGYDPNKPYDNRDPRMEMTIAVNGEKWPDTNPNPLEIYIGGRNALPIAGATPTGYYLKKYLDKTIDISASTSSGGKRHNWITYRLGEFYLNYAEAVFNYLGSADAVSTEFTMSAREAVNVVRNRSDVQMPEVPEGLTNNQFVEKYRRERMVELAFEQHRFWDVRRWKAGDTQRSIVQMQITKNNDTYTYKRVISNRYWDDKMYLFPIPDSEIRKNPNLIQNPGW